MNSKIHKKQTPAEGNGNPESFRAETPIGKFRPIPDRSQAKYLYEMAEKLRKEPFHLIPIRHNCMGKSFRLRLESRRVGVRGVKMVFSLGYVHNAKLPLPPFLPMYHVWVEYCGKRIEVARSLKTANP
jgi:hypothetical protein